MRRNRKASTQHALSVVAALDSTNVIRSPEIASSRIGPPVAGRSRWSPTAAKATLANRDRLPTARAPRGPAHEALHSNGTGQDRQKPPGSPGPFHMPIQVLTTHALGA